MASGRICAFWIGSPCWLGNHDMAACDLYAPQGVDLGGGGSSSQRNDTVNGLSWGGTCNCKAPLMRWKICGRALYKWDIYHLWWWRQWRWSWRWEPHLAVLAALGLLGQISHKGILYWKEINDETISYFRFLFLCSKILACTLIRQCAFLYTKYGIYYGTRLLSVDMVSMEIQYIMTSCTDLSVIIERGTILVLHILATRCEKSEGIEHFMSRLCSGRYKPVFVEQLWGVLQYGFMCPVVFTEQDLAPVMCRIVVIQPLKEWYVKIAVACEVGVHLKGNRKSFWLIKYSSK